MNADGSNPIPLTHDFGDYSPSWSPDGTRIAYQVTRTDGVWVVNADGSNPHVLFPGYKGTTRYAWATPTTFLAYNSIAIYRIDVGDTLEKVVLGNPLYNNTPWGFTPRLSTRDSTIAFAWEGIPGSDGENIYTVKLDGTGLKQVTHVQGAAILPVWSSDASRIAYVGNALDTQNTIWAVKPDGSDAHLVVTLSSSNAFLGDWR